MKEAVVVNSPIQEEAEMKVLTLSGYRLLGYGTE